MEINIIQAFLIGIVYYLGINGTPWLSLLGTHAWMRPMVNGTVVGLILGNPVQGCIIGTAINLPYLAFISAGGTVAMDPALAGTLGTALGMAAGVEPSVAVTLAVPIGLLGTIVWVLHMTVDITFVHMADKAAAEGNINKINFLHVVPPQIFCFAITVIPVMLACYYGSGFVADILNALEGKPLEVLTLIGGMLPALGIAMNLRSMNSNSTLIFFVLGFLLSIYSGLSILVLSIFGAIFAYVYTTLSLKEGA